MNSDKATVGSVVYTVYEDGQPYESCVLCYTGLEWCIWSELSLMLRLHYVPGGHGSHDFGHRGRNGVTVTQRRGTGSKNVARRGCRDRLDRFLNSQKICHGSHGGIDLLTCAVAERGERNKT